MDWMNFVIDGSDIRWTNGSIILTPLASINLIQCKLTSPKFSYRYARAVVPHVERSLKRSNKTSQGTLVGKNGAAEQMQETFPCCIVPTGTYEIFVVYRKEIFDRKITRSHKTTTMKNEKYIHM